MINSNYADATTSGTSYSYPIRSSNYNGLSLSKYSLYKDVKDYDTDCGCGYISDPVPVSIKPACFYNQKPHVYIEPKVQAQNDKDFYKINTPYYASAYREISQPPYSPTCYGLCNYPDMSIRNGTSFP